MTTEVGGKQSVCRQVTVAKGGGGRASKVKAEPQMIAAGASESLVPVFKIYVH